MKYIKKFKLNESGEWSSGVDWQYVKNNPEDDSEECVWIKYLANELAIIIDDLGDPSILEILDIKGHDLYIGPYARVKIFGKNYKVWSSDSVGNDLIIENFPITNNDEYSNPGYTGDKWEISNLLKDIAECGDIELYKISKKYNI